MYIIGMDPLVCMLVLVGFADGIVDFGKNIYLYPDFFFQFSR